MADPMTPPTPKQVVAMSRYQFAAIMMLLWGIVGKLNKPSLYSVCAFLCGFLYAVDAILALRKERSK